MKSHYLCSAEVIALFSWRTWHTLGNTTCSDHLAWWWRVGCDQRSCCSSGPANIAMITHWKNICTISVWNPPWSSRHGWLQWIQRKLRRNVHRADGLFHFANSLARQRRRNISRGSGCLLLMWSAVLCIWFAGRCDNAAMLFQKRCHTV